jgi:hypothetical protein
VPMMELTWQRVAYLASDIFPIFEHVHDIPINVDCSLRRCRYGNGK